MKAPSSAFEVSRVVRVVHAFEVKRLPTYVAGVAHDRTGRAEQAVESHKGADWNDFTNELPVADFVPKAIIGLA